MEIKFNQLPWTIQEKYTPANVAKAEVFDAAGHDPEWYQITTKSGHITKWNRVKVGLNCWVGWEHSRVSA